MEDAKVVLGRRLRQLRKERGLTQDQLAAAASEMSRVYLGALERGERSPGLEVLQRLARGLRVDVADLLREVEPTARNPRASRLTPQQRLARVVEELSRGADLESIKKFERLARIYFAK